MKKKLPQVVYISSEPDSDSNDDLSAWPSFSGAPNGIVATYQLVEVCEKRDAVEVRKLGTKSWSS